MKNQRQRKSCRVLRRSFVGISAHVRCRMQVISHLSAIVVGGLTVCATLNAAVPSHKCPMVPQVVLQSSASTISSRNLTPATITTIRQGDTATFEVMLRRRGASSRQLAKPSYSLKSTQGDIAFLDMRHDDDWILDGMATDPARLRNRLAMDLWAEIAPPLWYIHDEPNARSSYEGKIVEVGGNLTNGIYCLSERVDRKLLRLRKYDDIDTIAHGVLFKTSEWKYTTFLSAEGSQPADTAIRWGGWELDYPQPAALRPQAWQAFKRFYHITAESDSSLFADSIAAYVDIPSFIHYTLLVMFTGAIDNSGKNCYWAFYDITACNLRAVVVPWDFDLSFGRKYMGITVPANIQPMQRNRLHQRLLAFYPHYRDSLAQCYAELRQTTFTTHHLDSMVNNYIQLYRRTGLDSIEMQSWGNDTRLHLLFDTEPDYIHQWVADRLRWLDKLFLRTE